MDDREIQILGNYMASMSDLDVQAMDDVRKEFYDSVKIFYYRLLYMDLQVIFLELV